MQKRAYFVILLVAFSGLLFPPMTFAQNSVCPQTVSLGSTTLLLNPEDTSTDSDEKGPFIICDYRDPNAPKLSSGLSSVYMIAKVNWFYEEPSGYSNFFCVDSKTRHTNVGVRFNSSEEYTFLTIRTNAIPPLEITRDFAQQFFDLANNALSCSPSEPEQTEDEASEPQQDECRKTPNGVSTKIAHAVWGEPEIKIVGVFKDVQVLRDGKSLKATKGMIIHQCDVIETGDHGRVRIEFRDPYTVWAQNAGPSVLNLSPNSAIKIGEYGIFQKDGEANQSGLLEFLHGTFRAYAKQWGKTSIFSVKAGVALCGIRGSDMVFSYDPQQEKLSVFANEGEVSVKSETAGNTKMVTAGQSVIVEKGHINPVTTMSDFAWQSAVSKTVLPETQQASAQELGETQLNEPMEETTPLQDSGGGCLVATATYGSELAPQVQKLRELRDSKLLQTESGTSFIESFNSFYYSFSPYIADYERENPVFKQAVKLFITPMIASLSILNHVDMDSESEVLGYGISLIVLNLGMYVGMPVAVVIGMKKRLKIPQ